MVGEATAGEGSVVESKKSLKWTLGQNKQGSNPAASELTLEWGNRRGEVRRAESADLPAPPHQQGGMKSAVSSHSGVYGFLAFCAARLSLPAPQKVHAASSLWDGIQIHSLSHAIKYMG